MERYTNAESVGDTRVVVGAILVDSAREIVIVELPERSHAPDLDARSYPLSSHSPVRPLATFVVFWRVASADE